VDSALLAINCTVRILSLWQLLDAALSVDYGSAQGCLQEHSRIKEQVRLDDLRSCQTHCYRSPKHLSSMSKVSNLELIWMVIIILNSGSDALGQIGMQGICSTEILVGAKCFICFKTKQDMAIDCAFMCHAFLLIMSKFLRNINPVANFPPA